MQLRHGGHRCRIQLIGGEQYFLICWSFAQVCGNGLLEGGCMTQEKLAKHKDEQVNTSFPILEPTICADWQEPGKGQKLSHLLGFLKVPSCQVSFTWSINYYSTLVTIQWTLCRTYMQRMGLIPSDEETSSTSSVGARFRIPSCTNFQCQYYHQEGAF